MASANSVVASRSACIRCHRTNGLQFRKRKLKRLSCTITDVKGGFVASLEEEPREGGDLRLVCIANKHLYSDLSWYRITNQSTASEEHSVLAGELTEGQFSLTLRLQLKNVTAQDSGTYRCSTTRLLTGEHMNLDTPVEVTGVSKSCV